MRSFNTFLALTTSPALAENGIGRVISMLEAMKKTTTEEKQEESVKFSAFEQWCTGSRVELQASIERLTEEIATNTNVAEANEAKSRAKADAALKSAAEISANTATIATEKDARAEDKAEFEKVKKDYELSIAAIQEAIVVLRAQPASVAQQAGTASADPNSVLMQVKASTTLTADQIDTISMLVEGAVQHNKVLLQQAPGAHAYENQSSSVISMLEDLKGKFLEELNESSSQETKKAGSSATQIMSLNGQIENLEDQKSHQEQAKSKHDKLAGEARQQITLDQEELDGDQEKLSTVSANCDLKSEDYGQRSTMRDGEIQALGEAIEVMTGISGHYTSAGLIQESFLQMSSSRVAPKKNVIQRALDYLQKQGKVIKSKPLQMLAVQLMQNPFSKVTKMIEEMIDRLKAESLAQTGKFGECQRNISENKSDIESTEEKIGELKGKIDEESGTIGTMEDKIKTLSLSDQEVAALLQEEQKIRADDRIQNTKTVENCEQGEEAIDQAISILTDFYNSASSATALFQAKAMGLTKNFSKIPISAAPETWEGGYSGNHKGQKNIMSMLEVIQADFLKLRQETESAERQQQKNYDDLVKENEVSSAQRESNLLHAKKTLSTAKADLVAAEKDLEGQNQVLAAFVEQKRVIEQVKGCKAVGSPDEAFNAKHEAREAEIDSLKNALEMLK